MFRCIFHIDLDAFFVSVEQAHDPELKGSPVIVGGNPGHRGVVASSSYEARSFGIRAGMPLSQAHSLCPQAVFIQANFPRYKEASIKFMEILSSSSSNIEPLGLDEAYLDVTGGEGLYDFPRELALSIKERIHRELNITASVGIASCKVVAKIASDLCKPDGLLEIAPGEERDFLDPLPIKKLPGVGKKTEGFLQEKGITTIGKLACLSPETAKRLLGHFGVMLQQHACGIDERSVTTSGEPKSFSQEITFPRDTLDRRFLETNLRHLCQRIGEELRRRDKRAKCISLKLRYSDFKTIARQVTRKEASNVTQFIFSTASELLNGALRQREKPVRLIGVRVSHLVGQERQLSLFDLQRERAARVDQAIARIRQKYGTGSIKLGDSNNRDRRLSLFPGGSIMHVYKRNVRKENYHAALCFFSQRVHAPIRSQDRNFDPCSPLWDSLF